MSFSSRLKEKQEKEREQQGKERAQRIVRSGESSSQKPVNAFLEHRQARQREQDAQMKQAAQADHTMEKTDFFRADREQAAKDYTKQRLSRFQSDFYGNLTPNTYLDSASSEELSALRNAEKNRGKLADMAEEYARIRTNRPNNTVITNNLDTAGSEDLSAWAKQAKEANKKAYQNQKAMDQIGFKDEAGAFHRYDSLERQEPDFAEMVGAGKERDNIFDPTASYSPLDYLNKDKRAVIQGSQYNFTKMTDTEKDLYYYLNGKYGPQAAAKYIKTLGSELNRRNVEDVQESASSLAKEHPVLGVGLDAGIAMAGSGAYPVLLAEQAYNNMMGRYDDIDPNAPLFGSSVLGEGIRTGITNNEALSRAIPNEGLRNFLVGTGLSMTENLARLPLGHYGLAAAAGGAGLSGTREAVQRGGDNGQAIALGMANAAAEAFFEKFSLEGLETMKAAPGKGVREFLKNVGKQAVTEGSEEVFTEIANSISDRAIMGELSQYHLAYETYKAQGMDEKTAKQQAFLDFMKNVGEAGLGGALSGGVMGAGGQALGKMQESHALNQYGKGLDVDYRDYVNGFSGIQQESYADPTDYQEAVDLQQIAQEYADRQKNKETISNRDKAEYDLRFRQFAENTLRHNEEKTAQETNQNNQQTEETQQSEQTYTEAPKAEYEPYSEPETIQDHTPDAAEEGPEPAAPQGQPALKQETTQEAVYTPAETSPQDQTKVYRKPYGKNGQKALEKGYDGSIELSTYNKAFGRAYDAGYYNVDIDIAERSAIRSVIGNDQFLEAYKAGAQDYNLESKVQQTNMIQGAPKVGGLGTVSENATTAQRKVAEHIGKATGLKINLVDGMDQSNATGSYRNGEITISINSSDFNGSLTHELTHHIKEYSPKGYRLYTEIAVEALMRSENTSLENIVERYTNQYADAGQELTREEVMEEIVADATQKFFNDTEFINSIVNKDKTIAQRITDFLSDVIDSLKQLVKNGSTRAAAKGLEEDLRYYEDARDAWMQALADAGETYKSGIETQKEGQKERNALEKPDQVTERHIEDNYHTVVNMEPVSYLKGNEFMKGDKNLGQQVREYFASFGNVVHNDVVGDIIINNRSFKDDSSHGLGRLKSMTFKAVPEVLKNGKILNHSKNWKERGYDSVIIGAKINIESGEYEGDYYELCVVKVDESNRLYLHEVHTTKMDEASFKTGATQKSGLPGEAIHPSIYSIFDKLLNVNGEETKNQSGKMRLQLEDADIDPNDVKRLQEQNQILREANELLQEQFKLTSREDTRQEDITKIAKGILSKYQSDYSEKVLISNLTKLYEYIRSTGQVDRDGLTEAASGIARGILKQTKSQKQRQEADLVERYKGVRKEIKNTKIKLSDQDKADLGQMGGYEAFRKKYFGRITLSKDGTSIDSLYQELSAQHPELFPADITHPADQLMAVAHAIDQTQEYVQNPYHADMDEMSYIVGQEIIQSYFEIQNKIPTFADQKEAQLNQAKADYVSKMKKYQGDFNRKINQYKAELNDRYTKGIREANKDIANERQILAGQLKRAKERMENAIGDEWNEAKKEYNELMERGRDLNRQEAQIRYVLNPKKYVESMQKVRENKQKSSNKQKIIKDTMTIQNWLLKPDNKKHVPDEVKGIALEFIKSIDYSSKYLNQKGEPTQRTRAWDALQKFYESVKDGGEWMGENKESVYFDCDPDMINRMMELKEKVYDIERLEDLSPREMESLQKVVSSMKKTIMEMNDLKANKTAKRVEELAGKALGDLGKIAGENGRTEYGGTAGYADKLLNYDNLTPYTFFWKMGNAMESMYSTFRGAADKKTTMLKEAEDYIADVKKELKLTRKEILKWSGPEAKKQTFQVTGGRITLTPAQIMSLYEANKRGQARGHIYGDGIRSAPKLAKEKGVKGALKPSQIIKSYKPVKVSPADVENITSTLTPKQKQFADAIQEFLSTRAADWGNEASLLMYGYKKFVTRDYFPILTDGNYIQSKEGDLKNMQTTIRNLGMTKNTTPHANNAVVMDDILDIFSRHIDQMSTYSAFLAPLSDFNKVYNYKNREKMVSIKQEIERAMGSQAQDYIQNLIHDINSDFKGDNNIFEKFLSNQKAAAVAGSISVAVQQPSSILRAMAEIDPKYLGKGIATFTRKGQWDLICKYAPIAQWKDWGFYQMNTSRSIKDIMFETDSTLRRFTNRTMVLAERGDRLAWNRIWRACENEISDKHKDLKPGTEEYYQKVGERFSEIIDRTQVVDSVLHRSQIMRRKDLGLKTATAFMGEPTSTYNMLYRAAEGIKQKRPHAKAKAAKTAGAIAATMVLGAAFKSLATAPRDDDRDKGLLDKYTDAFWDNLLDSINPLGLVPFGKDVASIWQGYSATRMDVQGVQDVKNANDKIWKLIEGDNTMTPQYTAVYASKMLGNLFGTPASNIAREIETGLNVYHQYINKGLEDDYEWARQKYEIKNKSNLTIYVDMMIEAQRNGNKDLEKRIKTDLNKNEIDNETITAKIKSLIKGELISKDHVDPRIEEAAQARMAADTESYKAAVSELIAEGYAGKLVSSAVDTRINQLSGEEEIDWEEEAATDPDELYGEILTGEAEGEDWDIYSSADILKAVDQVGTTVESAKAFKKITTEIVDTKVKAGKTKNDAIGDIKSSISRRYKQEWIEAYLAKDQKGYEAIMAKLNRLTVNGKNLYTGEDYTKWRKEAKEKEKEGKK
nr:MAG TPA: Large polyvalent protein-associated domain 3 [Caudoviricetes sp.]